MDTPRKLIIATAASLSRLERRVYQQTISVRKLDNGHYERYPHWIAADLMPPSSWLQDYPGRTALTTVLTNIMDAQIYLLAILAAPDPIDLKLVCRALHHMCGSPPYWTEPVKRFALRVGIELNPEPYVEFNHAPLLAIPLPAPNER